MSNKRLTVTLPLPFYKTMAAQAKKEKRSLTKHLLLMLERAELMNKKTKGVNLDAKI